MTLLSVSVVSHGHGAHLLQLLQLLAQQPCRVWLTLNIPEPDVLRSLGGGDPQAGYVNGLSVIHLIHNASPKGFGANHNQAFIRDQSCPDAARNFAVLNPDLQWSSNPWPAMLDLVGQDRVGCVYPVQQDTNGHEQDHRRALPTPGALWHRYVRPKTLTVYSQPATDWVNAAMLLFPVEVYRALGGFDERYYMYCEDVDLCLRLQLSGYRLVEASSARVTHVAHRASHRNLRHLAWHLRSLTRLWLSRPYARYRRWCETGEPSLPNQ